MAAPERGWPHGAIDLLLKATLAPEETALSSWRAWTAKRDFEQVSWPEMRLLAPLASRLAILDPASPLRPRIDGLAKRLWTQTQLRFRETASAFDRLRQDGIPFLVFKGGAQYAEGLAVAIRRIMGDVDILVRPEQAVAALNALAADGWAATNGESFDLLRRLANVRLSGNFKKGENGEIDLHSSPFHFSRIDPGLDKELWALARETKLALRPVLVPDPTDSILLLLAHAVTSAAGDWAIDFAVRLDKQTIDWPRLAEIAARRGLVPACRTSLRYLALELGLAVPPDTLAALDRAPASFGERLKFWSNVRDRSDRNLLEKATNRLADRLLVQEGFSVIVKDRRAITVARAGVPLRWLLRLATPLNGTPQGEKLEHALSLPPGSAGRKLVLKLALAAPAMSRRVFFDVTANDIAIARLRSRAGGRLAGKEIRRIFCLPIPKRLIRNVEIVIRARPVRFIRPSASEDDLKALQPIAFKILSASVC